MASIPSDRFFGAPPRTPIHQDAFFEAPADAAQGDIKAWLWRMADQPWRMAAIMLGLGFLAVFVQQAPLLLQIILGAPIFEELLKFGLALLIAYPLRFLALRLPVAGAVGAGFGWLEHVTTYPEEEWVIYLGRVVFHAATTMLSMAALHGLHASLDARVRWFATLPATLIHYANNTAAVLTLTLLPFSERVFEAAGMAIGAAALTLLLLTLLTVPIWIGRYRRWAERRWRRWTQPQDASGTS